MDVAGKLKLRNAQGNDRSLNGRVGTASGVQGTANGDRSEKPRSPGPRVERGPGQSRPGPSIAAAPCSLTGRANQEALRAAK